MNEGNIGKEIDEIKALTEENNSILKSMRRHNRVGAFMRLIYWIIILGAAVSSYYYLQPFIEPMINSYKSIKEAGSKINNFSSWDKLKGYFGETNTGTPK